MEKAFPGLSSDVTVDGSRSISLSFYDENQNEKSIQNSSQPFRISIPRNKNSPPLFVNLINKNSNSTNTANLLTLDGFMLSKQNVSIHYHINPNDNQIGYFVALKFGDNPYLSSTIQLFDMWNIFCPQSNKLFFY